MLRKRSNALILTLVVTLCAGSMARAADRPNIVLILSDDQAWTDYGFVGHAKIRTPNLAERSLVFDRGYVASPLCRPSLASIIMVSWPGRVKPERIKDLAHAIGLFPTIAAAAGVEAPANLPGINLLDANARKGRKQVFGVTHSIHNMTIGDPDDTQQYLWCVEHEWKLLVRYSGKDTTRYRNVHVWDEAPVRLFNLKHDPHEKHDLAGKRPEIVERLKQAIEDWHSRAGDRPRVR